MKSKTSCFNKTIFKKNFTHFWPLWALYGCYLVFVLPVSLWLNISNNYYGNDVSPLSRQYSALNYTFSYALSPFPIFIFAALAAMAVFAYLYTAKNTNMIHALPVNRKELFITNFLSGFLYMVIPEIIAFVLAVFVCIGCHITNIEYLFFWLIIMVGMTFFAFSLAVFVGMFTGQIFALPVYYAVINYLYVGILYIINMLISTICFGVSNSWNPGKSCILSPVYYLNNNLRMRTIANSTTYQIEGLELKGAYLVGIYAAAAVFILIAAYQLYKKRQLEVAGDLISISIFKPIFRWGLTICGSFLIGSAASEIISSNISVIDNFWCLLAAVLVLGFICFFAAEMLMQKNFRVMKKKRLLEWAITAVLSVVFLGMFKLDVFGIESKIPDVADVEKAYISMDYPLKFEGEDIKIITELQKEVIDNKEVMLSCEDTYSTTFRYFLKDGTVFERTYPIPVTSEFLTDETTPTAKIIELERNKSNIKTNLLGKNYETNEYYSGYIDLTSEDGKSDMHVFSEKELEKLMDAIMEDIEEGNFDSYVLYSLNQDGEFYNGISVSYFNKDGVDRDEYRYYYNYSFEYEAAEKGETSKNGSTYFSFGPECVHTIKALEDLDIINDNWQLYTYEEYDKLVNY